VFCGSDHGGVLLKEYLLQEVGKIISKNHLVLEDVGCFSKDSVDYPDVANTLVKTMGSKTKNVDLKSPIGGLLICSTGIGISITANRYPFIRAGLSHNPQIARLCREHNNCNVLVLGEKFIDFDLALETFMTFVQTPFSHEERHERRVKKLETLPEF
jgi:ribose 5-phosphate isomerase B